jgi:type IX secretion system PorP/SprF family membrane protein
LLDVRFDQLNIYNPQDPWFSVNIDQRASPNVGLGLFYYDQGGYIGLSTTGILATKHFDQASPSSFLAADRAHYYLMAGRVIPLGDDMLFKPSFLIRHVKGVDLQMDISANFRIQDAVEAGLSYRLSGAVSALAAFRVQRNLLLGYSYDKETGRFGTFSGSTNEIFIRYELLPKTIKTIVKPRFF